MIKLERSHVDFMIEHGVEGYPNEVCGLILGRYEGDSREAAEIRRCANLNTERANDRFELDPRDMLSAEKYCREKGLEVIGIYHSHPDWPDEPSEFDRERAWPVYSYIIISVRKGEEPVFRSWRLDEETAGFTSEEIEILES